MMIQQVEFEVTSTSNVTVSFEFKMKVYMVISEIKSLQRRGLHWNKYI